jgi:cytochrome P450
MRTLRAEAVYYDPYDFLIDADPYPVWKRMRDEVPLYYNDRYDFYALSRYDEVEKASTEWRTYSSARGTVLEIIKQGAPVSPGMIIFEDPPVHDVHRSVMARVFTPRRVASLEPRVRALCAHALDRRVGTDGFDFMDVIGCHVPITVIGMLLGIPEKDLDVVADRTRKRHTLDKPEPKDMSSEVETLAMFAEYIDWRREHPSDDLMTQLLTTEFEDENGIRRTLTGTEALTYTQMLASAGNETTQRLLGWSAKVLADHPEPRREVHADRSLISNTIEELLRFESPSPVQARVTTRDVRLYDQPLPAGSTVLLLTGSANRDERHWLNPDRFDIHRRIDRHVAFGYGLHFCLGSALARLEGRVVLDEMLRRWKDWEVDHDGAVLDHTSTTRGWRSLPLRLT